MYSIYLTSISLGAHPQRIAELLPVGDRERASEICTVLQPHLRDGIEAHFASDDDDRTVLVGDTWETPADAAEYARAEAEALAADPPADSPDPRDWDRIFARVVGWQEEYAPGGMACDEREIAAEIWEAWEVLPGQQRSDLRKFIDDAMWARARA